MQKPPHSSSRGTTNTDTAIPTATATEKLSLAFAAIFYLAANKRRKVLGVCERHIHEMKSKKPEARKDASTQFS